MRCSLSSAFVYTCGNEPSMLQGGHATFHPVGVIQDSLLCGSKCSLSPGSLAEQRIGGGPQAWLFTHVLQAQSRHSCLGPFYRDAERGGRQEVKPTLV